MTWWDDANHFVNWFFLCAGIGLIVARTAVIQPWVLLWLTAGFGALLAIVWEVGEYFAFIRNSPELDTAYTDTLGDLSLGLGGSVLAATLTLSLSRRKSRIAFDPPSKEAETCRRCRP